MFLDARVNKIPIKITKRIHRNATFVTDHSSATISTTNLHFPAVVLTINCFPAPLPMCISMAGHVVLVRLVMLCSVWLCGWLLRKLFSFCLVASLGWLLTKDNHIRIVTGVFVFGCWCRCCGCCHCCSLLRLVKQSLQSHCSWLAATTTTTKKYGENER